MLVLCILLAISIIFLIERVWHLYEDNKRLTRIADCFEDDASTETEKAKAARNAFSMLVGTIVVKPHDLTDLQFISSLARFSMLFSSAERCTSFRELVDLNKVQEMWKDALLDVCLSRWPEQEEETA